MIAYQETDIPTVIALLREIWDRGNLSPLSNGMMDRIGTIIGEAA